MADKRTRWQISCVVQTTPGVYRVVVSRIYTKTKWAALSRLHKFILELDSKFFGIGAWLTAVVYLNDAQMCKLTLMLQEEIPTACEDRVFFADSKHVNADEALQAFCEF